MPKPLCQRQRTVAVKLMREIRLVFQQHPDSGFVPDPGGDVEWGCAVATDSLDIGAVFVLQQQPHRRNVLPPTRTHSQDQQSAR